MAGNGMVWQWSHDACCCVGRWWATPQGVLFCDGDVCADAIGMTAKRLRLWANLAWRTGPLEWKKEFGHATSSASVAVADAVDPQGAGDARVASRSHEWWASCSRADAMSALNVELAGGAEGCGALREVEVLARPFAVRCQATGATGTGAVGATEVLGTKDLPAPPAPPATRLISVDGVQVSTRVRSKLRLRAQSFGHVPHVQVLRHMLAAGGGW